ncbi:MAG: SLBB domain-containing protein [Phycisphaeraceae bacterium]|nr:SLBB domain-containing protein [Phycisphaeraceae bacterium]
MSIDVIQSCGVVGAGGAGFPTHVKLAAKAEVIILNAAECEPLLHKDKELLKHFGDEVLAGLEMGRQLVGAAKSVVGIKGKYHDVIDQLKPKLHPNMAIKELSDSYPAGDEFILVYDVTGKIIQPGKIPLSVGAVVMNVETALNAARRKPVTTKYLTIAGAVKNPVTVGVPLGVTFAQAIELAGGAAVPDPVLLVGGAMMGRFSEKFTEPITKTTGGLIVLPRDHPLVHRYTQPWKAIKTIGASCCDQCGFCTFYCPRYLLGHPIEPHKAMRSLGFNMAGESTTIGTQFCCECNLCTMMACPEDLDPKNVCTTNKRQLAAEGKKWDVQADPNRAELHLGNRRVPIARLVRKLGLSQFRNVGPYIKETVAAKKVTLPLKQHVGAPAVATVKVGDTVKAGAVIAQPAPKALGAVIHASIAGKVTQVTDVVVIEA